MVKKKSSAGPRLKLCSKCEEPNPPRQFYCRQCNHPFYSDEYFASRIKSSSPIVDGPDSEGVDNEYMNPPSRSDPYSVDPSLVEANLIARLGSNEPCVGTRFENEKKSRTITLNSKGGSLNNEILELEAGTTKSIDHGDQFIFTGADSVDAISFIGDYMAVLVDHRRVQVWSCKNALFTLMGDVELVPYSDNPVIKTVKWVQFSGQANGSIIGLLGIVLLDRVDIVSVKKNDKFNQHTFTLIWSSKIIPETYFPSNFDARVTQDGLNIELISTNNINNFVHYFVLSPTQERGTPLSITQLKVFGYNDPGRRVMSEEAEISSSIASGTCVTFFHDDMFKFATGYSNGQIVVYDKRDTHGPVSVLTSLGGLRRWLLDLVSLGDNDFLAALQAGCLISDLTSFQPIGGEVRTAQCFGIDAVGNNIFSAMSSGIVMSLDRTVRDKVRRAMTKTVALWTTSTMINRTEIAFGSLSLEEEILRRLTRPSVYENINVELFYDDKRNLGKNIKNLRASDGASNEPEIEQGRNGLTITCLRTQRSTGRVAYGTEAGFIHVLI